MRSERRKIIYNTLHSPLPHMKTITPPSSHNKKNIRNEFLRIKGIVVKYVEKGRETI